VNDGRAERAGRPSEVLVLEDELRSVIDWAALGRLGFAPDVALFAPARRTRYSGSPCAAPLRAIR